MPKCESFEWIDQIMYRWTRTYNLQPEERKEWVAIRRQTERMFSGQSDGIFLDLPSAATATVI